MAAARVLADLASRRGVPVCEVLDRVGITQSQLRSMTSRLEWTRFLALLDALAHRLGGAEALGAAASDFLDSAPELAQVAARFPTPASLMRFVFEVVHHLLFPMVQVELAVLGERHFKLVFTIESADRRHGLYALVSTSLARGVPRLLGCGLGEVSWKLTPTGTVFELRFPELPPRPPLSAAALQTLRDLGLSYLETFGREVPEVRTEACLRFQRLVDGLARPEPEERLRELAGQWALTPRQVDALRLLVSGLGNKDIAVQLGISHRTVEIHLSAVLQKSGVETRAQLLSRFWKQA